jgi:hypothetical protein
LIKMQGDTMKSTYIFLAVILAISVGLMALKSGLEFNKTGSAFYSYIDGADTNQMVRPPVVKTYAAVDYCGADNKGICSLINDGCGSRVHDAAYDEACPDVSASNYGICCVTPVNECTVSADCTNDVICKEPRCAANTCTLDMVASGLTDEACTGSLGGCGSSDCVCNGVGACINRQLSTTCGNRIIEPPEQCEAGQELLCRTTFGSAAYCKVNDCTCAGYCGNNIQEAGEECDGTDAAACGNAKCSGTCGCEAREFKQVKITEKLTLPGGRIVNNVVDSGSFWFEPDERLCDWSPDDACAQQCGYYGYGAGGSFERDDPGGHCGKYLCICYALVINPPGG